MRWLAFLTLTLLILGAKLTADRHRQHMPAQPLTAVELCAHPSSETMKKACEEYTEAVAILNGNRGFAPVDGIRPLTNFELRPAHGGPIVHDSLKAVSCSTCTCRADGGSYSVIGFSGDHHQVLMERMSEQDENDVCERGTRFFIPIDWLKPTATKITQK